MACPKPPPKTAEDFFEQQSDQVFIGMITMQYQAKQVKTWTEGRGMWRGGGTGFGNSGEDGCIREGRRNQGAGRI